jgi:peroxiredoxin Q/BCP
MTRDVPWVNLLLFGLGVWLLVSGIRRAFADPPVSPIKMMGVGGVAVVSVAALLLFVMWRFVWTALPPSPNAARIGDRAPEFTLLDDHSRSVSLASLLGSPLANGTAPGRPPKAVLLIFYMYSDCRACNTEFHTMQQRLGDLAGAGIRPVAISIDPPDVSRRLTEEAAYTFTFLSDPKLDVIRAYGVADQDEGARPAEFLVDAGGVVRWRNLSSNVYVRTTPDQVIDAAKVLP